MTAIKPPSLSTPTVADPAAATSAGSTGATGTGFSEALSQARSAAAPTAKDGINATQQGSVSELARELEGGRLSAEQAVDRLVERAAASLEHSLAPDERAELVEMLKSALASDPTLSALRDRLG